MEWVHVSDLVAGRSVNPDFVPRVLAYVEAKAAYEALSKGCSYSTRLRRRGSWTTS